MFFMCVFLSSVGGVGFALYSVRERLVKDGVLARRPSFCERASAAVCGFVVPFTPLAATVASTSLVREGAVLSEEAILTATHW